LQLKVSGVQAGLFRQQFHRDGTERHAIVISEQDIMPSRSLQDAVGTFLSLDAPADSEQRSEGS